MSAARVVVVCVDARWRVAVAPDGDRVALPSRPAGRDPALAAAEAVSALGLAVPVLLPRARLVDPGGDVLVFVGHVTEAPSETAWLRPSEAPRRLDALGARAVARALTAC